MEMEAEFIVVELKNGGRFEFGCEDLDLHIDDADGIAAFVMEALIRNGEKTSGIKKIMVQ
jgi:hypothetical protein